MNLILIDAADRISDSRAIIRGRALKHARAVLAAKPGDCLRVGIVGGKMASARITSQNDERIEIEFESWEAPPPAIDIDLYLCLPRPKILLRVLQTAASLGIKNIHLMNAYRVEKSFWHCEQLQPTRIDLALRLGLEQARDTILPQVSLHRRLKPFAQDELAALVKGRRALIAHPAAIEACPSLPGEAVGLAVGPEGGFIPYEVDLFASAGFRAISLGPRILKVETAVTALIARLVF